MKILVPLAGKSSFFDDKNSPFSKPLIEIKGKSMIERVIENLSTIKGDYEFVFVVNSEDCKKYHLDNILNLLSKNSKIVKINGETKGALCSILLAIEHINTNEELIICNGDQVLNFDFNKAISFFKSQKYDAGLITFESVHPRWSYVRFDNNNLVVETAEKRPISKHAIAGVYYFKNGKDFLKGAKESIIKGDSTNGAYYIAPSINQLILQNKVVGTFSINTKSYHSFYSPQKIREFENENI